MAKNIEFPTSPKSDRALSVGPTQSLACFRQVAESAETVEVIIPHLVGSKTGGICCYSTQSGSTHLPLSPGSEGQPAIRPWFSPDKDPFAPFDFEGPTKKPVPVAGPGVPRSARFQSVSYDLAHFRLFCLQPQERWPKDLKSKVPWWCACLFSAAEFWGSYSSSWSLSWAT